MILIRSHYVDYHYSAYLNASECQGWFGHTISVNTHDITHLAGDSKFKENIVKLVLRLSMCLRNLLSYRTMPRFFC